MSELPREMLPKVVKELGAISATTARALTPQFHEMCQALTLDQSTLVVCYRTVGGAGDKQWQRLVTVKRTDDGWALAQDFTIAQPEALWSRKGGAKQGLYDGTYEPAELPQAKR